MRHTYDESPMTKNDPVHFNGEFKSGKYEKIKVNAGLDRCFSVENCNKITLDES